MERPSGNSPANRRLEPRKGVRQPCTLILPGQPPRSARTWDLGQDGLSLHTARPVPPGTRAQVQLELPLKRGPQMLQVNVRTLYSSFGGTDGFRIGALFVGLDDAARQIIADYLADL